jgi:hypothetical protein
MILNKEQCKYDNLTLPFNPENSYIQQAGLPKPWLTAVILRGLGMIVLTNNNKVVKPKVQHTAHCWSQSQPLLSTSHLTPNTHNIFQNVILTPQKQK